MPFITKFKQPVNFLYFMFIVSQFHKQQTIGISLSGKLKLIMLQYH